MSLDLPPAPDAIAEARRQSEICNACRYCEGYCDVFPAMFSERVFSDGDITQLANLCHNCRGCYYACQYTEPHDFALNLPAALADVRAESWERFAWPGALGGLFHRSGVALAAALVLGIAALFLALKAFAPSGGAGFYAYLSHGAMVAIFLPAFLLPVVAIGVGLRRYWSEVGGGPLRWAHFAEAGRRTANLRNLAGGQGQGCNFEKGDRYSQARRHAHQAAFWGFLLCFGATSAGTVMHYGLGMEAPYGFFSLPKLLGVPGGVLLVLGTGLLAWLKTRADPQLGASGVWGGAMAFVLLPDLARGDERLDRVQNMRRAADPVGRGDAQPRRPCPERGERRMGQHRLRARCAGQGGRADQQVGRGHHQLFEGQRAAAAQAERARDVPEPGGAQDIVRQRARAKAVAIGMIERGAVARFVPRARLERRAPRVEPRNERRTRRLATQHTGHLRDPRARVLERPGGVELLHPQPDAAQHRHRRRVRIGPREHQVGPQQVDLFGAPVIDRVGARLARHGRTLRIGGEGGDRDQLSGRRQHHRKLIGAQVDRHDAGGGRVGTGHGPRECEGQAEGYEPRRTHAAPRRPRGPRC